MRDTKVWQILRNSLVTTDIWRDSLGINRISKKKYEKSRKFEEIKTIQKYC